VILPPLVFPAFFVQINQDHLREGIQDGRSILNPMPTTVAGNVKNVVGWRGGAERGFLSVYSDCIHVSMLLGPSLMELWA